MRMHKFVGVPAQRFWAAILVVLLFSVVLTAQITFERTYGGAKVDAAQSVLQTSDGGYIIVGTTESYGAGGADIYLIKTNSVGDTLPAEDETGWARTYGGTSHDAGLSVQQTSDGGYIITGWTESYGAGGSDVYLIKTDVSGDTLPAEDGTGWTRTYGGTTTDCGWSVQETQDGGYIITGATWRDTTGYPDIYLIKTNSSGDTLWTRAYGGAAWDIGFFVRQTRDGGYIITGYTNSSGAGACDAYLIKTDASGKIVWTKTYGGTNDDIGASVQQTSDGGYIIAGETDSYGAGRGDVYLIKTDASGNVKMKLTQKELEKVVIITKVSEGSQAENVGLKEGDIIVEYDGVQIITPEQLAEEKEKGLDKEQIVMVVVRDKEYKQFTLKGGEIGIHMEVTGVPEAQLPKEPSVVETLTGKPPIVLFRVKQNGNMVISTRLAR